MRMTGISLPCYGRALRLGGWKLRWRVRWAGAGGRAPEYRGPPRGGGRRRLCGSVPVPCCYIEAFLMPVKPRFTPPGQGHKQADPAFGFFCSRRGVGRWGGGVVGDFAVGLSRLGVCVCMVPSLPFIACWSRFSRPGVFSHPGWAAAFEKGKNARLPGPGPRRGGAQGRRGGSVGRVVFPTRPPLQRPLCSRVEATKRANSNEDNAVAPVGGGRWAQWVGGSSGVTVL